MKKTNTFAPRLGAVYALALISCLGSAQQIERQAFRRVLGPKAVIESTFDGKPRIMPSMSPGIQRPENPQIPSIIRQDTETNTLPLGGLLSEPRVSTAGSSRFPGLNMNGWIPADCTIAVGPTKIVETINSDIAIFSKSGSKLYQRGLIGGSGFFGSVGAGSFVFDPKAFYDQISGRFFVIALDQSDSNQFSYIDVAVSMSSDPEGAWAKYRINVKVTQGSQGFWLDYPGWGCNKDAVVCSGNMFGFSGGYAGAQFIVMSKAEMLAGGQPKVTYLLDPGEGTAQIAKTVDPNIDRIYAVTNHSSSQLRLYALKNLTSTPSFTALNIPIPSYIYPSRNAQSTGTRQLDGFGDSRIFTAAFRAGHLVAAHNVQVSSSDNRIGSRWYDIDMSNWPVSGTPKLKQSGIVTGSSGQDAHMPGININKRGAISMLYTRSSSSIAADMMAVGRKPTDPLGFMGTPTLIESSTGSYGGSGVNRWGDYWSVDTDPVDDETFWGVVMVGKSDGSFGTAIRNWKIFVPADEGAVVAADAIGMYQGASSTGGVNDVKTQDGATFNVLSTLTTLGQIAAAQVDFKVAQQPAEIGAITLKMVSSMPANATGQVFLYNWTTGAYDFYKSYPAPTTSAPILVDIPKSYRDGSGKVRIMCRVIAPIRFRVQPAPFLYRFDLVQLIIAGA